MYSFDNRDDTICLDEPMYAYYLHHTGINHPGREEIIQSQPTDLSEAIAVMLSDQYHSELLFIKGMAHHYHGVKDLAFLNGFVNIFLIREPSRLISSFAQVITHPTIQDIGLKHEWDLFQILSKMGGDSIVIDSGELLNNPEEYLTYMCDKMGIPFSNKMLHWPSGQKACDGVWARYWYKNVWRSTGFEKQKTSDRPFPDYLNGLLEEANQYYQLLRQHALKIS